MKNQLDTAILDNLTEGFQVISFDWRYVYVNETVARHGKQTKDRLLGKTMMEMYPGIQYTDMFHILKRCMRYRIAERMENQFEYPDGTKGWFELRIEPVSEGLFILSIDISERKKIEEKLNKLNKVLENKVALRTAELELKNRDIIDSIEYAKRIQQAKLPSKKEIYKVLPNSFVLLRPKAIVSGDFYFFHQGDDCIYLAAADCTGHGVPGAMMSMLCSEKLNNVVSKNDNTSDILMQLNQGIKSSLRQSENEDSSKDGMDIAICSIDSKSKKLKYAGANRPLWIIRKGKDSVDEIKATKRSIGGFTEDNQYFHSHEIHINKGDTIYLFSDGYADLFNGKSGKKLTIKKFKQILLDIQHKSMKEQEKHLLDFADAWRGGAEQVDDILVIGVRM